MSLIDRTAIEQRELLLLAPYAARAVESRGRVYPQPEHPLRTVYQRDRDRIIHSAAFRRMEYKTQVFLPHEADHFRTRLTHTIEVAQVSRTLARNLRLNEDLTEAVALVHDLGHTPFGHAGEHILDALLESFGGFNHNRQSLRVVDLLEQRYRDHPGLNLTYEVREGIAKHETSKPLASPEFEAHTWPTLEASLVDQADSLTYTAHDIDDGISSGLLTINEFAELSIWGQTPSERGFDFNDESFCSLADDQKRHQMVRFVLNRTATDILEETNRQLQRRRVEGLDQVRHAQERLCRFTTDMYARVKELKEFLFARLYKHPQLLLHSDRARVIVSTLFDRIVAQPDRMPERFQEMLCTTPIQIVVADYIAGMTDRYAERLYRELSKP